MPNNPINAYQTVDKATASGREVEAAALTKGALLLAEAQQKWAEPERDQLLETALTYNQRLWSLLQTELADPSNPLPEEIKTNLLVLSALVDKRVFEVMAYPAPEKLNLIISVNRNIAAGLRGDPG
ncbi:MAG: flagellar biosynthesis regulator FlaF [Betaproteobacteria bacterium]|nr:flagellar biosynthesis regulator FlaF [Betaproteobacteria bacterium]